MNNVNNVCLVCLCNRDQNILNQVLCKGKENEIVTYVKYVFPELTVLDSESSVYICSSCHTPLHSFYKFKKQCLDNYDRLTHYTKDTKNIQEQNQSFSDTQNSNETIIKQEEQEPYIDLNITPEKISALLEDDKESVPVAEPEMVIIPNIKVENEDSLSFSNEEETAVEDFMDYTEEGDEEDQDDIDFKEESFSSDDSEDRELYQELVKNESVSDFVQDDGSAETSASEVNNSNAATQKLQCTVCSKYFRRSYLKEHMKFHFGVRDLECSVCKKKFLRNNHLKQHMKYHLGIRDFECSICSSKFTEKGTLNRHMKSHLGIKECECSICHKKFSENHFLTMHMKYHLGIRDFECTICNKKYVSNSRLQRHIKTHSDTNEFQCTICNKKLSRNSTLVAHMKFHSDLKDFKCTVCNKRFITKKDHERHSKTHDTSKDLKCSVCNKNFVLKGNLEKHLKTHEVS